MPGPGFGPGRGPGGPGGPRRGRPGFGPHHHHHGPMPPLPPRFGRRFYGPRQGCLWTLLLPTALVIALPAMLL